MAYLQCDVAFFYYFPQEAHFRPQISSNGLYCSYVDVFYIDAIFTCECLCLHEIWDVISNVCNLIYFTIINYFFITCLYIFIKPCFNCLKLCHHSYYKFSSLYIFVPDVIRSWYPCVWFLLYLILMFLIKKPKKFSLYVEVLEHC